MTVNIKENQKVLMKGNHAIGEGAVQAGCRYFFGYPITPQSELAEYLALRLPEVGGVYLQAESEIAAINMVYGAAGGGARALTASSGPGISLMQEGISVIAGAEVPCVIANIMRTGPGLGELWPSQGDYFQAVRGGGHGDYYSIVLAPASVQEMFSLTICAFDIADEYRIPVILLCDGLLGQMKELVDLDLALRRNLSNKKEWALTGCRGRAKRKILSDPKPFESHIQHLHEKYRAIRDREPRYETFFLEDAEIVITAFGSMARISRAAVKKARGQGMKVGLIRPITLWPFPSSIYQEIDNSVKLLLVVEMNMGQMLEDVKLAVKGSMDIYFLGRPEVLIPSGEDILSKIKSLVSTKRGLV